MGKSQVFHGALGIIKVNGIVVGKAKNVRANENYRRVEAMGLGTIFASEAPPVAFSGTVSVGFIEVSFKKTGLPGAIKRDFENVGSQVLTGGESFEDQILLDADGITMEIYKKVEDFIDPATGNIRPKLEPYAVVRNMLIESDSFDLSEGALAGHDQSFKYLTPITN